MKKIGWFATCLLSISGWLLGTPVDDLISKPKDLSSWSKVVIDQSFRHVAYQAEPKIGGYQICLGDEIPVEKMECWPKVVLAARKKAKHEIVCGDTKCHDRIFDGKKCYCIHSQGVLDAAQVAECSHLRLGDDVVAIQSGHKVQTKIDHFEWALDEMTPTYFAKFRLACKYRPMHDISFIPITNSVQSDIEALPLSPSAKEDRDQFRRAVHKKFDAEEGSSKLSDIQIMNIYGTHFMIGTHNMGGYSTSTYVSDGSHVFEFNRETFESAVRIGDRYFLALYGTGDTDCSCLWLVEISINGLRCVRTGTGYCGD